MRVKVGQWARWNFGLIAQFGYVAIPYENAKIISVANTPQGLVQVGDLYKNRGRYYFINDKEDLIDFKKLFVYKNKPKRAQYQKLEEILTKDLEGNYIKQWEADNESK
jgi:hypothetical protein